MYIFITFLFQQMRDIIFGINKSSGVVSELSQKPERWIVPHHIDF